MGFDVNSVRLLIKARENGVNFEEVICIGRQGLHLKKHQMMGLLSESGILGKGIKNEYEFDPYAESFLKLLGARITDSLDASDYEKATQIHDMNLPLPETMKSKYSLVIDGGSLEHVFNFPTAIKNCMDLIKLNGHFIGISPTNNFCGHGFYQFSPELFFRIFDESNGFKTVKVFFYVDDRSGKAAVFEVKDPLQIKERVTLINSKRSYLFVIAQKIANKRVFDKAPQQSDYEHVLWEHKPYGDSNQPAKPIKFKWLKQLIPSALKIKLYRNKRKLVKSYNRHLKPTGDSNPKFFKSADKS